MNLLAAFPPPKYTGPILQLEKYTAAVPDAPRKVYYEYKIPAGEWGMLGNDTVGDCEIARLLHIIMSATAHTGTMLIPTVDKAIAVYSAISGYDPNDPSTDVGCNSADVFNYWQNT